VGEQVAKDGVGTEGGASGLGGLVNFEGSGGKNFSWFIFSWMCHIREARACLQTVLRTKSWEILSREGWWERDIPISSSRSWIALRNE